MLFRNYMGLLTLLNAWVLLHAFVFEPKNSGRRWMWFGVAGLVFGLTFLVRIDLGQLFAVIYLGLIVLYPLGIRGGFRGRLPVALGGGAVSVAAALAIHAPFYLDARHRGFDKEFVGDYLTKWSFIKYEAGRRIFGERPEPAPSPAPTPSASADREEWAPVRFKKTPRDWVRRAQAQQAAHSASAAQGRPRQELRDVFKQGSFYDAAFILILHLPVLIAGLLVAAAGAGLVWAILTADAALKESALVCLVTLGSALTLFSQYFFFRPDTPHLSEFMIPFGVALACASYYAVRWAVRTRLWIIRIGCFSFTVLCAGNETLYFYHSFRKESAGTIFAAHKRSYEVVADNGVKVLVKRREQPWLQNLHDTVVRYAAPGEWVVTFPYSPTINFMTNRPSYLKDLYIDDVTGRNLVRQKIKEIELHRPAVIVIDQRDINNTENSRFKNWAAPAYDYIRSHYVRIPAEFDTNEIYVRPDKMRPQA